MFHRHKWEEVNRNYTPSWANGLKANWVSEETIRVLTMGVTVIELRCVECGDLKHREVIGKI